MSWVFNHAPDDVEAGDMLVLLVLAEHANAEGGLAYPSVKRIATMARMSERGVQYVLRRLVERGVIRVQYAATNKRPTVYCFPAFRGEESAPPRGEEHAPQEEARGATDDRLGVQPTTSRGAKLLHPNRTEPSVGTVSETMSPLVGSRRPYPEDFEAFWKDYPPVTNNSKKKAHNAWKHLSAADKALAVEALPKYRASQGWREGYATHASTFLNSRLFEVEPVDRPPRPSNGRYEPENRAPKPPPIERVLQPRKQLSPEKLAELREWRGER